MRILMGKYARKELFLPPSSLTRPTSQKVREAIFNILANWIDIKETIVLDAFAGSGAFGLEALSRGAKKAYFVENHSRVLPFLIRNIDLLKFQDVSVVLKANMITLKLFPEPCAVIFLDPPYGKNLLKPSLEALIKAGAFQPESYVVIECDRREVPHIPPKIEPKITKIYGDTKIIVGQFFP